jgi:hypothetical protein
MAFFNEIYHLIELKEINLMIVLLLENIKKLRISRVI